MFRVSSGSSLQQSHISQRSPASATAAGTLLSSAYSFPTTTVSASVVSASESASSPLPGNEHSNGTPLTSEEASVVPPFSAEPHLLSQSGVASEGAPSQQPSTTPVTGSSSSSLSVSSPWNSESFCYTSATHSSVSPSCTQLPSRASLDGVALMRDRTGSSFFRYGGLRLVDWSGGEPEQLQQIQSKAGEVFFTHKSNCIAKSNHVKSHSHDEQEKNSAKLLRRRVLPCTLTDRDATLNACISGGSGPALCQLQQQLKHLSGGDGEGISPKPWVDYCLRKKSSRGDARSLEKTGTCCMRSAKSASHCKSSCVNGRGSLDNNVDGACAKNEKELHVEGRDPSIEPTTSHLKVEDTLRQEVDQQKGGGVEAYSGRVGGGGRVSGGSGHDHCLGQQDAPSFSHNGTADVVSHETPDSLHRSSPIEKGISDHRVSGSSVNKGVKRKGAGVDGDEASFGSGTKRRQGEDEDDERVLCSRTTHANPPSDEEEKEKEAEEEITEMNFVRRFLAVSATPEDLPSCPVLSTTQGDGISLLLGGARGTVGVCEGGRFRWEVKILDIARNGLDSGGGGSMDFSSGTNRSGSEGGRVLSIPSLSEGRHSGGANGLPLNDGISPPVREGTNVTTSSEHQAPNGESTSVTTNNTATTTSRTGLSSILPPSHRFIFASSPTYSFQRTFGEGLVRVGFCTAEDSLFLGDSVTSLGIDSDGYVVHAGEVLRQETPEEEDSLQRGAGLWDAFLSAKSSIHSSPNCGHLPSGGGPFPSPQQEGTGGEGEIGGASYFPSDGGEIAQGGGGQETLPSCPPTTASFPLPGPPALPGGVFFSKENRLCRPYLRAGDVLTVILNMRKEEWREDGLCKACGGVRVWKGDVVSENDRESMGQTEKKEGEKAQIGRNGAEGGDDEKKKKRRKKRGGGGHAYYTIDETLGTIEKQGNLKKEADKADHNTTMKTKRKPACSCWSVSFFCNGERLLAPVKLPEECRGQVLFPCINLRCATVLVNFGCVPSFCSLPFACPMLQDHSFSSSCHSPSVSLSPHQLNFIPSQEELESPSGTPAEAEVTVCVGLPGMGVFDFLDEWKTGRERKRGRPIFEISARTIAQWAQYSLSHGVRGPKCPLNHGGSRSTFRALEDSCGGADNSHSNLNGSSTSCSTSAGAMTTGPSQRKCCRCYEEGSASTRAAAVIADLSAGNATYSSSYRGGGWRGGRDEDLVVESSSLGLGIPGLDDVASLKRSLEAIAASCRRADFVIVSLLANLREGHRRKLLALFSAPWFSCRCLLVVGPPPLNFLTRMQQKLHMDQPRLHFVIQQLQKRYAQAEEARDTSTCQAIEADLRRFQKSLEDALQVHPPETFDPAQPWINPLVDDVPLRQITSRLDQLSIPSQAEGFNEIEVAWRSSLKDVSDNFFTWKDRMMKRRYDRDLKPPPWMAAQLRNWDDKKNTLRQHQRAVATRYARALRYLDASSTVMPTDFDFGYADLNHVIKEGGDKEGGNNSVNKLLQALKSVEQHEEETRAWPSSDASLASSASSSDANYGHSGSFGESGAAEAVPNEPGSLEERRLEVERAADQEINAYGLNVEWGASNQHYSEGAWLPVVCYVGPAAQVPSASPSAGVGESPFSIAMAGGSLGAAGLPCDWGGPAGVAAAAAMGFGSSSTDGYRTDSEQGTSLTHHLQSQSSGSVQCTTAEADSVSAGSNAASTQSSAGGQGGQVADYKGEEGHSHHLVSTPAETAARAALAAKAMLAASLSQNNDGGSRKREKGREEGTDSSGSKKGGGEASSVTSSPVITAKSEASLAELGGGGGTNEENQTKNKETLEQSVLDSIVREHTLRMDHVNKAVALSQASGTPGSNTSAGAAAVAAAAMLSPNVTVLGSSNGNEHGLLQCAGNGQKRSERFSSAYRRCFPLMDAFLSSFISSTRTGNFLRLA
ncbi:transmembrane protein [Cystoisospora suis]|uniref:Transmembrane protein n=1 Tax=Cystoisospora suis TaxID=483139 RepID=A0A2C6KPI6_9APIC|nr:transmembrane protein [Cystoisospora suis]